MTIEEARKIIESNITAYTLANPEATKFVEALYMAIRSLEAWQKVREEIASYKDDKLIHAERNEMIDIVLEIICKHISGKE